MLLKPPEYASFQWLAETMTDIPCEVPGAVKIKTIKQGEGPMVPSNTVVMIHYAAYWEHERRPFESSIKLSRKAKFHQVFLRERMCPKGLLLAFTSVRGPTAHFLALLAPEVMWGVNDLSPPLRPEPALYVIALFAVKELQAHNMFYFLNKEEQGKYAIVASTVQYLRDKGKGFFQTQRYDRAMEAYDRAFDVLLRCRPQNEQEEQAVKDSRVQVLVNSAVCGYKLDKPRRVLKLCKWITQFIDIDTHCKALFYRGRAYEKLLKHEEALEQYKKALNLEPNNREISAAMTDLSTRINKFKVVESNMWQNVFNKLNEETETHEVPKAKPTRPIGKEGILKLFRPGANPLEACTQMLLDMRLETDSDSD